MRGILDVCYHTNKEVSRKKQVSKSISSFSTNQTDKSFHLDFSHDNRKFTLDIYHDCFGLTETTDSSNPKTLAYVEFEDEATNTSDITQRN